MLNPVSSSFGHASQLTHLTKDTCTPWIPDIQLMRPVSLGAGKYELLVPVKGIDEFSSGCSGLNARCPREYMDIGLEGGIHAGFCFAPACDLYPL